MASIIYNENNVLHNLKHTG